LLWIRLWIISESYILGTTANQPFRLWFSGSDLSHKPVLNHLVSPRLKKPLFGSPLPRTRRIFRTTFRVTSSPFIWDGNVINLRNFFLLEFINCRWSQAWPRRWTKDGSVRAQA
jgi:hypothetical protein